LLTPTLLSIADRYRSKAVSPVEIARAILANFDAVERKLNAFILREDPDRVNEAAAESEARWRKGSSLGPLDGIPVTIKDTIWVAGWPTRSGSCTSSTAPSAEDAPGVARLREAGAIILGKTTTPEFGWKAVTDSPLTGLSFNPWDTAKTPGGSSGGAAAAVAADLAFASLGTDAGGSVRIPGSFCGLVALKATRGRIPAFPPAAVWTLGHNGPIGRSVEDIAMLLDVLAGVDQRDWNALPPSGVRYLDTLRRSSLDLAGLRIAYSPTLGHARVDPVVTKLVAAAAARLAELGAAVDEVESPFPDARAAFKTYFQTGIAHALRGLPEQRWDELDPDLAKVLEGAKRISRSDFLEAYEFQVRISREARLFHNRYDLLITPTAAVPAFEAGKLSPPGYDPLNWLDWAPFAYPFNLSGQPALTVNCGYTNDNLPVGLQLVGPMHDEMVILRAALAYEASMAESTNPPPSRLKVSFR
jgi:aspartyl-tRNA(Asn)/glutamyl-tRNA(Gln) amidotransferase subunit A